jgi:spore maturation protein CgeB
MNILVIGNFYTGAFGKHTAEVLEDMGHTVFHFEPGIKFKHNTILGKRWNTVRYTLYTEVFSKMSAVRNRNVKPLYSLLSENSIDLTIVLHDYLDPSQVKKIKEKTKSPIVLWFPDALSNFKKSMFLIAAYDILFFVDKYIVHELRNDYNLNTYYLPQACYPKYHQKVQLSSEEQKLYGCDIGNVGNMYPARIALYRQLKNYNFKMWGDLPPVWANDPIVKPMLQGVAVHHEEKAKAFNGAKIILNNLHPAVINGVNKRTFEVAGCGAFQLIKHRDALEDLFIEGKEIVSYKNFNDLIEKIDYYLQNDKEREEIAKAAMIRAHKEHTLEIRLQELIDQITNN